MSNDPPDLEDAVREIEQSVGLKPGFLESIYEDSADWSFVVKVHALLDAAIVHLIVEALGKQELTDVVGYLSFDGRTGKMLIAEKLKLLERPSIAFLRRLNTIRNQFAHDVTNTDLRIEQIVNGNPNEADGVWRDLARGFASDTDEIRVSKDLVMPSGQFAKENPRTIILLAAMNTIGLIYMTKRETNKRRQLAEKMASFAELLIRSGEPPSGPFGSTDPTKPPQFPVESDVEAS